MMWLDDEQLGASPRIVSSVVSSSQVGVASLAVLSERRRSRGEGRVDRHHSGWFECEQLEGWSVCLRSGGSSSSGLAGAVPQHHAASDSGLKHSTNEHRSNAPRDSPDTHDGSPAAPRCNLVVASFPPVEQPFCLAFVPAPSLVVARSTARDGRNEHSVTLHVARAISDERSA